MSEALSAQAEADLVNHRAAAARRAAASKWRAKQRERDIWRWQAIWREMETARARVQQIVRIVARGQWRGRYPEVLIVENATQLMDLLYNQLEAQPPGDRCWGGRNTPVDEVPIVALASGVAAAWGGGAVPHWLGGNGRPRGALRPKDTAESRRDFRRRGSPRRRCYRGSGRRRSCCQEGRATGRPRGALASGRLAARGCSTSRPTLANPIAVASPSRRCASCWRLRGPRFGRTDRHARWLSSSPTPL